MEWYWNMKYKKLMILKKSQFWCSFDTFFNFLYTSWRREYLKNSYLDRLYIIYTWHPGFKECDKPLISGINHLSIRLHMVFHVKKIIRKKMEIICCHEKDLEYISGIFEVYDTQQWIGNNPWKFQDQ